MKILVNTASTHKGGGVQVARSFIEECRSFPEHNFYIVLGKMLSDLIDPKEYPSNFSFYSFDYRPATRLFSLRSPGRDFVKIEQDIKPDIVFTTSGPAYWKPGAPHLVGYNLPHYIYGDSPFFGQLPMLKRGKYAIKGQALKYFFRRDADAYVVQTDDVNQRLRKWLKREQVYTVSNTYSQHYNNPKKVDNKLPEREGAEFRFLTLSAWHPHKNLDVIPHVVEALPGEVKQRVQFVLTLPDEIFRDKISAEMSDNIVNTGPVKPEEGPALYKECDAMFLPTLLECFSASYAEAMKMEKPIVTSDLGFARTVCGDAAIYADPVDSQALASKIVELVGDPALQQRLIQNGRRQMRSFLTAGERAEEYLRICKELVENGKR